MVGLSASQGTARLAGESTGARGRPPTETPTRSEEYSRRRETARPGEAPRDEHFQLPTSPRASQHHAYRRFANTCNLMRRVMDV